MALAIKNLPAIVADVRDAVRSLGWEEPLEESKEIHSNIPAWRIPRTEEPGRLQSIGQQTVGHDRSDIAHTHGGIWDTRGRMAGFQTRKG